jgi:hypothetical protein
MFIKSFSLVLVTASVFLGFSGFAQEKSAEKADQRIGIAIQLPGAEAKPGFHLALDSYHNLFDGRGKKMDYNDLKGIIESRNHKIHINLFIRDKKEIKLMEISKLLKYINGLAKEGSQITVNVLLN